MVRLLRFCSPDDEWHWASFHVSVGHLYSFLGKMFIHVFCPFFNCIICFLGIEFYKFFVKLWILALYRYVIFKYLLPSHRLSFSFVDYFLHCAKLFILLKYLQFSFGSVYLALGDISRKKTDVKELTACVLL